MALRMRAEGRHTIYAKYSLSHNFSPKGLDC